MEKHKTKSENRAQAEAFRRMNGNELEMIHEYGAEFRQIIMDFENSHNRTPTADELLWIVSELRGRDITE